MVLIGELANIMAPILICVSIGIIWAISKTDFDTKLITSLIYNVGGPCLILATFHKVQLSNSALTEIALATLSCYLFFTIFSMVSLLLFRQDLPSYLPSLIFPLTGSMGLPVCYFAYGDAGLALALVYFTFGAIGTFTIGAAIAEGKFAPKHLFRSPFIYAVLLAIALQNTNTQLPIWIFNSLDLLGQMVIPAQLVALGVSLLQLKGATFKKSAFLAAFRILLGIAVGYGVAEIFDLNGALRAVVILQSAMPVAVSNYLFAAKFGRRPEEVAGMVIVSTLISFFSLPILLIFVL
tara:strand:- start:523 stop:1404 length:882 start_codon:yes stop_codon:yes gene_type:complete